MIKSVCWGVVAVAMIVVAARFASGDLRGQETDARAVDARVQTRESQPRARLLSVDVAPRIAQKTAEPQRNLGVARRFSIFGLDASFELNLDLAANDDRFVVASPNADDASPVFSAWAKFPVGTWARRRATSVSRENGKTTQSAIETRATLMSVELKNRRYTLKIDSTVKVGDADYSTRVETLEYDFWDVPTDENARVENLAPVNLMLAGRAVPCKTRRTTRVLDGVKETTVVWYSPVVAPYVLQKETTREPVDKSEENARVARELYVVQRTPTATLFGAFQQNYVAVGATSGKRRLTSTKNCALNLPGGAARETVVEPNPDGGAPLYQVDEALLDYYVPQ